MIQSKTVIRLPKGQQAQNQYNDQRQQDYTENRNPNIQAQPKVSYIKHTPAKKTTSGSML